jgi:hypothetical protein
MCSLSVGRDVQRRAETCRDVQRPVQSACMTGQSRDFLLELIMAMTYHNSVLTKAGIAYDVLRLAQRHSCRYSRLPIAKREPPVSYAVLDLPPTVVWSYRLL